MKSIKFIFLFMVLLAAAGCGPQDNAGEPAIVENAFIERYTPSVSADAPVRIQLREGWRVSGSSTTDQLRTAVRIRPEIAFTVSVPSPGTILLIPEKPLENNARYRCTVYLGKILVRDESSSDTYTAENSNGTRPDFGTSDPYSGSAGNRPQPKDETFSFEFATPVPLFEYDGALRTDPDRENAYYLEGTLTTSDYVAPENIERLFVIQTNPPQEKQPVPVWEHSDDGRRHIVRSAPVTAGNTGKKCIVRADYSSFGSNGIISDTLSVPKADVFGIMEVKTADDPQRAELFFTAPPDPKQPVLQTVSLAGTGYRYAIEGNKLTLYPRQRLAGEYTLQIDKNFRSRKNEMLETEYSARISFEEPKPEIRLVSRGIFLPSGNRNTIVFQSVNYAKARIRVKRIFENNILQFLQNNETDGYYLYNVSAVAADTVIVLGSPDTPSLKGKANYGLRLDELIDARPGDMYHIEIKGIDPLVPEPENTWDSDYYFGDYATYAERSSNVYATDLALIVKGNDENDYTAFVTDLMSGKPVSGAKVQAYSQVNQLLGEAVTDKEGRAVFSTPEEAYTIFASYRKDRTFLKAAKGNALSISNFDVEGTREAGSVKAYIFGERGVWRPGDTLHIAVIPFFEGTSVPDGYPVTATLYNPKGQPVRRIVRQNKTGICRFDFATRPDAPTGRWEVKAEIGNRIFAKGIKIETIKPNRLKIAMNFGPGEYSDPRRMESRLQIDWLYGAPGARLECETEGLFTKGKTTFEGYKAYTFEDPTRSFYKDRYPAGSGTTSDAGSLELPRRIDLDFGRAPGFLNALFTVRAYEPSGEYSTASFGRTLSPFDTYVGMYLPEEEGSWGDFYIDKNRDHQLRIAALDPDGKPSGLQEVRAEIYRADWRWWWNADYGGDASYANDSRLELIRREQVKLTGGKGTLRCSWKEEDYGYYFIRISDPEGGHACARTYLVSDETYGRSASSPSDGSTQLSITSDKNVYRAGETARLTIPSAAGARALISLEKGERILKSFWVDCTAEKTQISIPIEKQMSPNIYASVSLIQPHERTLNDAPIRMYGILRLDVEDPSSILHPELQLPEQVRPESKMTVRIREKEGRPMSYLLMAVDEGLLGLTNFKTPDPWGYLYAREAPGLRTWDLFDKVIGAYGGRIEQLFAIGGDEDAGRINAPEANAMRFKPVAAVLGPFTLDAGKTALHEIALPQYIGSLRVMAVATDGRAMGSTSGTVFVKKPLMVQATLPRIVSTGETILLPVTLFALEDGIGETEVSVETSPEFRIEGAARQTVRSEKAGEQLLYFTLRASDRPADGKIIVAARSAKERSRDETDLKIINPNPPVTATETFVLQAGKEREIDFRLAGAPGTNRAAAELSSVPPLNLGRRLEYLLSYPHGCVEQIVSSAFAQLGVSGFLSRPEQRRRAERNINSALNRLPEFLLADGSLSYWQGMNTASVWGTIYAAHFMIRAQENGYLLPAGVKEAVFGFLDRTISRRSDDRYLEQAYALYVLALDRRFRQGALNRMKERFPSLPEDARWLTAASYSLYGKPAVARELLEQIRQNTATGQPADPFSGTFDSPDRTAALALTAYLSAGEPEQAFETARILSEYLNDSRRFMSTQSSAWSLIALSDFIRSQPAGRPEVLLSAGNRNLAAAGDPKEDSENMLTFELPAEAAQIRLEKNRSDNNETNGNSPEISVLPVTIRNTGRTPVYCVLSSTGIPARGAEKATARGLSLRIRYETESGQPLDFRHIPQGTDFYSVVTITNTGAARDYTNLVLNQKFASGWEIAETRLGRPEQLPEGVDYRDIRDDRIYTYFNLPHGRSITLRTRLTATYRGRFYLPAASCEAMYDGNVFASGTGSWCEVGRRTEQ